MAITVDDIREWSKVDFAALDYAAPTGYADDPLEKLLDRAIEYVLNVTGLGTEDNVPSDLTNTWEEAVQRRTEQLTFKSQEDEVDTGSDFELINNFTAGSYSETRRGMGETQKAKMINPWPLLNDLLWRLATLDKRDEWIDYWAGGALAPAFEVSEIDWDVYHPISPYYPGS